MKVSDFSSIVQMGVGLHLGAALLQQYGDLGVDKLARTNSRILAMIAENSEIHSRFSTRQHMLESRLSVFKIQFSQEFGYLRTINTIIGLVLLIALFAMTFAADHQMPLWLGILVAVASVFPALISLWHLRREARKRIGRLLDEAYLLERECLLAARAT